MGRITLNGFLNYDPELFSGVVLPEGLSKNYLVNEIMKRGDLYPYHQSLPALKRNIEDWFSRKSYDFQMMFDALRAEYSPIENYDRKESIDRRSERSGTDTTTGQNRADTGSNFSHSENLRDDTEQTESVSAFNAADFSDANKSVLGKSASNNSSDNSTSQASGSSSSSTTYGSGNHETEENRIHGNIGVTTAQQMINEEITMRQRFDLYRVIADLFEAEFLIQVY